MTSHEQFLSSIYSRLSKLKSSKPSRPKFVSHHSTKLNCSQKLNEDHLIQISIRRFDNKLINVDVSKEARVYQLKNAIKQTFANKSIHWKTIWKRYALATNDHQQLINDNRQIKHYGVIQNCELSFVRRRRFK